MDLMSTAQLLGNLGEFLGAIAVVVTLFYLAVQVRHGKEATEANTHSLDESRKLAAAQAYQNRSTQLEQAASAFAESDYLPEIMIKYEQGGLEALNAIEASRMRQRVVGLVSRLDNIHYQYQQGFTDDEFYNSVFVDVVKKTEPRMRDFDIDVGGRPSFKAEVERIASEAR